MDVYRDEIKHAELTDRIIGVFYDVYNELGFGFLESVYENALAMALGEAGLNVAQQAPVSVYFRGRAVGSFCCDLLVKRNVILELKAARQIAPSTSPRRSIT